MSYRSFMFFALMFVSIVGLLVAGAEFGLVTGGAPQWRMQRQDALIIPQGGYIGLQADGLDASSLHQAVLSTNETGTWENETASAFMWSQSAVNGRMRAAYCTLRPRETTTCTL
jgi:hypothetical protein